MAVELLRRSPWEYYATSQQCIITKLTNWNLSYLSIISLLNMLEMFFQHLIHLTNLNAAQDRRGC